jgi:uncharacterized protein YbcC (UPF0753/DUF2309 family)
MSIQRYNQNKNKTLVKSAKGEWVRYEDAEQAIRYIVRMLDVPEEDVEYFVKDALERGV